MITFDKFGGIAPRFPDRQLPKPYALSAVNCKMDRGQLRAFGGSEAVFGGTNIEATTKTIFFYKPEDITYLLQFSEKADVVQNAHPLDAYKRLYWSKETGVPQMASYTQVLGAQPRPSDSYILGIPSPSTAPVLERVVTANSPDQASIDDGSAVPYIRAFTYSFVSHFKEESPPYADPNGNALATITLYEGDEVRVSNLETAPTGDYAMDSGLGARKYLYMQDVNGSLRLAANLTLAATEITFNHMDISTAPLINADIKIGANPNPNMKGLSMSNFGFMFGFVDNTVCVSSKYLYHNWPVQYRRPVPSKILKAVPMAQGQLLITEGGVYIAMGADPSNITILEVSSTMGCVSKDSIVDMGSFVLYASRNGIVRADGTGAELVSTDVILENDWAQYQPETFVGYRHLSRYILIGAVRSFIVNPYGTFDRLMDLDVVTAFPNSGGAINAGITSTTDDYLYYSIGDGALYKFDANPASPLSYEWESATDIQATTVVPSCFRIDAENFNDLYFNVYMDGLPLFVGDGILIDPLAANGHYFYGRLPSFPPSLDVRISLKGSSQVNHVILSDNFEEMKRFR